MKNDSHIELPLNDPDPIIRWSHHAIRWAVKILAILMVVIIFFGIGDIFYVLYDRLTTEPMYLLDISDIFETFAAFLAVLVAIEIFVNIRIYLSSSELPVKLVLATALMAVARKAIVLDFSKLEWQEVVSLSAIILALGVSYALILYFKSDSPEARASALPAEITGPEADAGKVRVKAS